MLETLPRQAFVIDMPESLDQWAERVCLGDGRAIARAISAVEGGTATSIPLLKLLFPRAGKAFVVGVTGSPGSGKSTLLEKLAVEYRRSGAPVGIVAVDPTSPFSGGAILGDRIRMQALSMDRGVYIRSMATRGQLGGLAPKAHDVVMILDAAGCEVIFVETVGVGQDEVDVARLADATLVLLTPGMGDDIQTFKAGVMEIADLFVINKSDQPGADRVEQALTAMLSIAIPPDAPPPPILRTVATTGQGVPELRKTLLEFHQADELAAHRKREHLRARLFELLRQSLFEKVVVPHLQDGVLEHYLDEILARRRDPHSVVEEIMR